MNEFGTPKEARVESAAPVESHEAAACRRLICAIIEQGLRDDLGLPVIKGTLPARPWVTTEDFRKYCDLAGLDAGAIRARIECPVSREAIRKRIIGSYSHRGTGVRA